VAEVVGDLAHREPCLVQPGGHRLAEDVQGDPVEPARPRILRGSPLLLWGPVASPSGSGRRRRRPWPTQDDCATGRLYKWVARRRLRS
jgi:hypothetical protein